MDAKIALYNNERMEKSEKKNEQKGQDFKEALLKNIQEITAQKIQKQKLAAEVL